jgi:hypothetical protein
MEPPRLLGQRKGQRGAVLMIGMVMLLMVMLIAVGAIRLATRHTQVVNNEQVRTEAVAAANYALDAVLTQPYSSTTWNNYKGSTGSTISVNLGRTQTADSSNGVPGGVAVKVTNLTCKRGRVLSNSELFNSSGQVTDPYDKTCIYQAPPAGLTIGANASSNQSLCGSALWEMQAQVNDPSLLAATAPVVAGVEVRILATDVDSTCK